MVIGTSWRPRAVAGIEVPYPGMPTKGLPPPGDAGMAALRLPPAVPPILLWQ